MFRDYHIKKIKEISTSKSKEIFPNGGFVIGLKKDIIILLNKNSKEEDDQMGYHYMLIENPNLLYLDYDQEIVYSYAWCYGK